MVIFLAKITNRENVDKVQKREIFIHEDIYNFESEIKVGMPVFLVFSGDKSIIDWPQGLAGIGKVEKAPYDKGYNKEKKRYFRIKIKPIYVLDKPLEPKATKLHPKYQKELYDVPYIGANHFPNQAIAKATGTGALALFNLLKESDANGLNEFNEYLSQHIYGNETKEQYKKFLLRKNEPSTVSSYINALDNVPNYLREKGVKCNFEWKRIIDIETLKKSAKFVKDESKNNDGGLLSEYRPKSHWSNGWFYLGINNYINFLNEVPDMLPRTSFLELSSLASDLLTSGLIFRNRLVIRFVSSLLTKPFVILTGLSGSGKTKLAQCFARWICQNNNHYKIIPVGADWTNREPLLGYPNALKPEEYIKPENGALDLIIQANNNPDLPYFMILDEMNLSYVERYFADFLSAMESNEDIPLHSGSVKDGTPEKIKLPDNLFILGTVNVDETTYMFSPKVLDRANTIEFRVDKEEMASFLDNFSEVDIESLTGKGTSMAKSFLDMSRSREVSEDNSNIKETLVTFFAQLKKAGAEFGYRSANEIIQLINKLSLIDKDMSAEQKIDIAIIQKLLPKLHGSRRKLCPVLLKMAGFCITEEVKNIESEIFDNEEFNFNDSGKVKFPLSLEKITRMYKSAVENGFTSYAEA